jgi:hypothetical protein
MKSAAAAGQARVTADLDAVRRAKEAAAGVPAAQRGRGLASEIALARRDSPNRGGRHLGLARALVHEMPHTLAALAAGVLSEWRATLIVRESACLDVEDRRTLDAELCSDLAGLEGLGMPASPQRPRPSPTASTRTRSWTARCAPSPNAPSPSARHPMR